MFTIAQLPPLAFTSVIAYLLWQGVRLALHCAHKSPLQHLCGPKGTSFILGNLGDMMKDKDGTLSEKWVAKYGKVMRFKGFLSRDKLFTMDPCAINHVLTHSSDYYKSPTIQQGSLEVFGEGLLQVDGAQHRQQRHIMNPAFGPSQIRGHVDAFFFKASQLRDVLSLELNNSASLNSGTRINFMPWLNKVTFDIIGLSGFNYDFDSLDAKGRLNELKKAFSMLCSGVTASDLVLRSLFPVLRFVPTPKTRSLRAVQRTIAQKCGQLLRDAKASVLSNDTGKGEIEKNDLRGRDLLTLLVKANMATDIPESQKLSDKHVIAQLTTFFIAGHETTSSAIAWALYALTQAPEVQTKLRDELLSVDTDNPSMDELMKLPYLDAFVRESLRMNPPVTAIMRIAMKDDVLPVEKPYVDRYGNVHDNIRIGKGDEVMFSIEMMNRSKELWGPDAGEFKPERWINIPETVSRIPGIWGHMLTFNGGPRACIGYRFALVEFKVILFTLVRAFEFELAVPASDICDNVAITRRPALRSDPTRKPQLPLLIRPYQEV